MYHLLFRGKKGQAHYSSCLTLAAIIVFASHSFGTYEIAQDVIAGGGGNSATGVYKDSAVAAQSSPVDTSSSATYTITHGYLVETDIFPNTFRLAGLTENCHGYGVAWTDINGDGLWDLYVTRGSGADYQDHLYVNNGNNTFSESASSLIGAENVIGYGAAFADYDSDGDLDGYVQNTLAGGKLWNNDGSSFSDQMAAEGIVPVSSQMSSWGDLDADGLIDLLIANDSGGVPALFHNTGNYAVGGSQGFVPTVTAPIAATQGVASWADLNNDGYADIYVAQSGAAPDILLLNNGNGTFTDQSAACGINIVSRNSQGVAFGDYNNDGYLDIYVSCGGADSDILWLNAGDTSPADGNWDGTFTDASATAGIADTADGRSCLWFDVDNDGDQDIYVANTGGADFLYINKGEAVPPVTFRRLETAAYNDSYGCATADYDKDGDLDIVVSGDQNFLTLYRNESPNHNYIRVRPTDGNGNLNCFGAQVVLYDNAAPGTVVAMVHIDGGSGRGCQNQYDAHFAVPDNTTEYDVEVRFMQTSGGEQVIINGDTAPELNGITAGDIDLGYIEVMENGRLEYSHGVAYSHTVATEDIYVLPTIGGTPKKLSSSVGNNMEPSWAPDGQKLVFVSDRIDAGELFTISANGTNESPLLAPQWNGSKESGPAWSSDGASIAFVTDKDSNSEIYVANTGGTEWRNLTEDPAEDIDPVWSPSSNKIAFTTNRVDGDWDIYSMNFDGSNVVSLSDTDGVTPELLVDNTANDIEPCYHPTGLGIAFVSDRDSSVYQVFVMNFDGTTQQQITFGGNDKHHPVFTPDGQEIIYETNGQLHIMNFDGTNDRIMDGAGINNRYPNYPLLFRPPPRSIVFGIQDGRIMYWADPVNTQLGNFTRAETDFVLPGFGDPVIWSRNYNSQDTMVGPLGYGWRFSYQISVSEEADGSTTVSWGDGTQDFYFFNPLTATYIPLEDRTTHTFVKNGDDSYTLTRQDGTVYEFYPIGVHNKIYDPTILGKIKTITDKNGNWTSFTYDVNGLLTEVTQENNRNLAITWETDPTYGPRITVITENIPGLSTPRSVTYAYDVDGHLDRVTHKDGIQYTRYLYDLHHRMTEVYSLQDGVAEINLVYNEYDDDGRVYLQRDPNGNISTLDYSEDTGQLVTTVTDARSNTQQHVYDRYRRLVQYKNESDDILQYHYDANGFKKQVVDKEGNVFRISPNSLGQPIAIEDPLGISEQVSYESNGNPESRTVSPDMAEPTQDRSTQYAYDASGNLEAVTDPLGNLAETRYNSHGQPIEVEDEFDNITEMIYDPATGDLLTIRNVLGHETNMEYDERGRLLRVIDAESNAVEYSYRDDDQPEWTKDARGNYTYFDYYQGGQLKAVRNQLGHESSFTYDALNVDTATDPRGHTVSYTYDENNNVTKVSDTYKGTPREFVYTYDEQNRVTRITDPYNNFIEYTYDKHGRVVTVQDARGQQYHTEYDTAGNKVRTYATLGTDTLEVLYDYNDAGELIQTTLIDPLGPQPAGIITQFIYDKLGRLVTTFDDAGNDNTTTYYDTNGTGAFYGAVSTITDVNGRQTRYEYDLIGRTVNTYDNLNQRTHYVYDDAGLLIAQQADPDDLDGDLDLVETTYEYDENGNLVKTITAAGDVIETEYDELNRPLKAYLPYPESGARGGYTEYRYDENTHTGLLTTVIDPELHATMFAYDELGQRTTVTDAEGNSVESAYDLLGRVVQVIASLATTDETETLYEYDANGNRTKITKVMETPAENQVHLFQYDLFNRNTQYTGPLNRVTTMQYDLVGKLKRHETHDNLVTQYQYDSLYRLVRTDYPDGSSATRTYDDLAVPHPHPRNILQVTNTDLGTINWTYDGLDRVATVTDNFGKTVGYSYDHLGRLEQLEYPGSLPVAYTYNNRNQVASVTDWLGNSALYDYDDYGRLERQDNSNGTHTGYTYQENGWLESLVTWSDGSPDPIASYDLVTDTVGNRTQIVRNEPVLPLPSSDNTSSTYDLGNQIETDGTMDYVFDDRGNLIEEKLGAATLKSYVYDHANRLVTVVDETSGTPVVTEYEYDTEGNRLVSTHDGQEKQFTLDISGMSQVLSENDSSSSPNWYYVYANGLTWRVNASTNETQFYHGDYIGSVNAMTDAAGNTIQAYSYDAFGETYGVLSQAILQPFQYVGTLGVQQEINKLQFMRARYYKSDLGIFLTLDSVFGTNSYSYSINNPIVYIDSDGNYFQAKAGVEFAGVAKLAGASASYLATYDTNNGIDNEILTTVDVAFCPTAVDGSALLVGEFVFAEAKSTKQVGLVGGAGIGGKVALVVDTEEDRIVGFAAGVGFAGGLAVFANLLTASTPGPRGDISDEPYFTDINKGQDTMLPDGVGTGIAYNFTSVNPNLIDAGPFNYDHCVADVYSLAAMDNKPNRIISDTSDNNINNSVSNRSSYSGSAWREANPAKAAAWEERVKQYQEKQAKRKRGGVDKAWKKYQERLIQKQWEEKQAAVQAQINSITGGRGWDAMAGAHGLSHTTVNYEWLGFSQNYLTGFWYSNVARIAGAAIPGAKAAAAQKAMSAHATLLNSVRTGIMENYGAGTGANGRNTPYIPEVYQISDMEGMQRSFSK